MAMLIDFMRHGEPVGGRRIRGQSRDDPLSEQGWLQMRAIDTADYTRVISSPLLRCQEFAREVAATRNIPLQIDARWQEVNLGEWEGDTLAAVAAHSPARYAAFRRDPEQTRPPGAESLADFSARVGAAFAALAEYGEAEQMLVVTHAGVIRMLVIDLLQAAWARLNHIEVPYAARTRVCWDAERGPLLVGLNC